MVSAGAVVWFVAGGNGITSGQLGFRGISGRNNPVAMNAIRLRFLSGWMLPVHFPVCLASGMECFPLSGLLL